MSKILPSRTPRETQTAQELLATSGDQALQKLLEGHHRYLAGQSLHPHQEAAHRLTIAQHQHPFAVIFGCADSRVSPEIIFDQGLGDLFVIRVAGHVLDAAALGSLEYAAVELGVPLVMVLGHQRCGAVKAAVEAVERGSPVPGHLPTLVDAIRPAVAKAKSFPGDLLDNAVRAHVAVVVGQLQSSEPILAALVRANKVKIVGARNDLDSGVVEIVA